MKLVEERDEVRDHPDLQAARKVLDIEAEGLAALSRVLDSEFVSAVDCLSRVKGRVIVTGMGKSGHVARKIAATLASTGTPAQFVHPGEASHGDLGMVTANDALIGLSNSGDTVELSDIVSHSRRFAIPFIAMTGKRASTLAEAADVALVLPDVPEACPMGLAPTTSTTLMLVLGDALAVALLERKGFTLQDYKVLHPGGSLGRKLLRVEDLMHRGGEVPLCGETDAMSDAILMMTHKSFGCVGVLDEGAHLIGIITDGDLRRHMDTALLDRRAGDIMTSSPRTIRPGALAAEALNVMNSNAITSLFVVTDDRPIGILHMHDCLRAGVA